jgi:hypothetical protein
MQLASAWLVCSPRRKRVLLRAGCAEQDLQPDIGSCPLNPNRKRRAHPQAVVAARRRPTHEPAWRSAALPSAGLTAEASRALMSMLRVAPVHAQMWLEGADWSSALRCRPSGRRGPSSNPTVRASAWQISARCPPRRRRATRRCPGARSTPGDEGERPAGGALTPFLFRVSSATAVRLGRSPHLMVPCKTAPRLHRLPPKRAA